MIKVCINGGRDTKKFMRRRQINISTVVFKDDSNNIYKLINSCLDSKLVFRFYLIDNSPNKKLEKLSNLSDKIIYIFNGANLGYGKAHNIAIKETIKHAIPYHLVVNPDVYFSPDVLEELYSFMENNSDVGLVMPKVLYPDGGLQYLCKLLPTPIDLIGRRFLSWGPFKKYVYKRNELYELRFTGYDKIMEIPNLSGCFMFLRTSVLEKIGLFDERFFMYLEDTDLSRRINVVAKTIFYPYVHIYHEYNRGSYKSLRLLKIHIESAIKYFNKWGWFRDIERDKINSRVLQKLQK